jgi:hypothetical protein
MMGDIESVKMFNVESVLHRISKRFGIPMSELEVCLNDISYEETAMTRGEVVAEATNVEPRSDLVASPTVGNLALKEADPKAQNAEEKKAQKVEEKKAQRAKEAEKKKAQKAQKAKESVDTSVENWIGPINEMWISHRYDILSQIELLSKYSQPNLLMVGRTMGLTLPASSNKSSIIVNVIKCHILTQIIPRVETMCLYQHALIHHAYDMLIETVFDGFLVSRAPRLILKEALEEYYVAHTGRRRMVSIAKSR